VKEISCVSNRPRKNETATHRACRNGCGARAEGMPDEKIRQVVESKRQWIYEKTGHPLKYGDLPHGLGKELVGGESIPYLGRQHRIGLVRAGLDQIQFSRRFLIPDIEGEKKRGP
jgi:hypothetical protein